jgi:HSP20 family protein
MRTAFTEPRRWSPDVDMLDVDDEIIVRAELQGVDEKNIDVSIYDDALTIRGEGKMEDDYYYCDWAPASYGKFYRMVPLPIGVDVDASRMRTSCIDGIIEVHLPKITPRRSDERS